jgi:hypothetical protein
MIKKNARQWTETDMEELRAHSIARTPVIKISKAANRTISALRAKAMTMRIPLGHQR